MTNTRHASVLLAVVTSLLCAATTGSAQVCAKSAQHWDYDVWTAPDGVATNWYMQNRYGICRLTDNYDECVRAWNTDLYAHRYNLRLSDASTLHIGVLGVRMFNRVTGATLAQIAVPAVCHTPAGGGASSDGHVVFVGPATYNASDIRQPPNATAYGLRGNTSMCFGAGNDAVKVLTTSTLNCGGSVLQPINYNGFNFYLQTQEGADSLIGGLGVDVVMGGNDPDRLYGGKSADNLFGDGGNDFLFGNAADDLYQGGIGNDWLSDDAGYRDRMYGGDGSDCFFDAQSSSVDGQSGTDICPSSTRAGAASVTSCETSWGWCIPE